MTPPTTAPGPQPHQASALLEVAIAGKFDAQILLFCSSNAKDRAAPELIRGRCTPSSKNGDDAFP
jgi:hypothetical protein